VGGQLHIRRDRTGITREFGDADRLSIAAEQNDERRQNAAA